MITENFLEKTNCIRPATGESWVRSATTLKSDRKLTPTARDVYDVLLELKNQEKKAV